MWTLTVIRHVCVVINPCQLLSLLPLRFPRRTANADYWFFTGIQWLERPIMEDYIHQAWPRCWEMEKDWMLQTIQLAPHKCMYSVCFFKEHSNTSHVYRFGTLTMYCWDSDPDKRLTFTQLQTNISAKLIITAGYLDLSAFSDSVSWAWESVSVKRFLKRNLAHVGMVQCMNALVDKVQKQEVPCTQWYMYM